MQIKSKNIYSYLVVFVFSMLMVSTSYCQQQKQSFFQLKIFQLKNNDELQRLDSFLKNDYLPALHRAGISKVGVFIPIANDTSAIKKMYVFIPFHSSNEWMQLDNKLLEDVVYRSAGKLFNSTDTAYAPYERIESVLLEAMPAAPDFILPVSKSTTRVFELRDYESPTEELLAKKLQMFNEGGETKIFKRLDFNAVFYSKVISGSKMPDLMYMISFESVAARDAHWKQFGDDAKWKEISTDTMYENKISVSHIESILMHSASYSDF